MRAEAQEIGAGLGVGIWWLFEKGRRFVLILNLELCGVGVV
jgi:hypothetical protein